MIVNMMNMMSLDTSTNLRTFFDFKTQFSIVNIINVMWFDTSTNLRTLFI